MPASSTEPQDSVWPFLMLICRDMAPASSGAAGWDWRDRSNQGTPAVGPTTHGSGTGGQNVER